MKKILGEYDCVSAASINPERLRQAHLTPCDQATAYLLIAVLHEKYLKGFQAPLVRFRQPQLGKKGARGWGGIKNGRGYVSLPANSYDPKVHATPYGQLRIGLVIHEFAHAVQYLKDGKSGHGPNFTLLLDTFLYDTVHIWGRV